MEAICIETANENPELLRQRLAKQMEGWYQRGLVKEFSETCNGPLTVWGCKPYSDNQVCNLRALTAQVLADYIIGEVEPVLLRKLAAMHHPHLEGHERDKICDMVVQRLWREEMLTGESRRQNIIKKIELCLEQQGQINIEGFLRFRLQDYQRNLLSYINQGADDYLVEREYQDFINLLKYFVEIQQPRYNEVHLLYKDNYILLCDSSFRPLHRERVRDMEGADAIVSTLVTTAPQRVVIHISGNNIDQDLISTINSIFGSRVVQCPGCDRCR